MGCQTVTPVALAGTVDEHRRSGPARPLHIVTTADTYSHALPEALHRTAEATARLVLAAARHQRHNTLA